MISTVSLNEDNSYCVTLDNRLVLSVPKSVDNRHYRMAQEWLADGNSLSVEPLAKRKTKALQDLKSKRSAIENGGLTLNGAAIDTDSNAQVKLMAARIKAKEDPTYSVKWKNPIGVFTMLNSATMIAIADASLAHIAASFERESVLTDTINNSDNPESVDISTGWPS